MNVNLAHAKIMLLVFRVSPAILATVNQVLLEVIARLTSMNVRTYLVKTMDYVSTESTRFNAIVIILVLKGILARLTFKNATVTLVKMVLHVLMESMIMIVYVGEVMKVKIVK